ncbi:MAG: oxidoreductase [Nitrospirae bacterium CG_4_9_14_3_um_filter_53_35]|nr:MAG: hypothetical protein AUK29_08050 [Nitrospirae bacterium CG2_30_53_67]PIS38598.1 MAG: oxidoreductase [Nitrospirae bacterium CG08_land_8_20_14_0_20_52_24]PIV85390.1 MAG: oxidoreductase [Nitrospirae bacterium CG17_big_fil_post_rev_8_21_14_2_50_50_9]PIW84248.1 MAG: oxidoreductase [Nitrospirae bacterium CG_4_8_14_3_um_filter_50_41]PIX86259.1 MAG: oxidoreductase [Nitrospirae bacterium CG_4_10_14_3_um_filter_53_41]PJA74647.1 MAG: oxidoreductase [Nitrospirae bacterium CG_4_9_14_3_um_filter_53_
MSEKILVTGGTGFTGRNLSLKLLEKGYEVRALVRKGSRYEDLEKSGCEIAFGDLANGSGIDAAARGVDVVYHIAAAFRVEGVAKKYFWDVNVEGTRKLLDASLRYHVRRFVHCSTVGVHGEIEHPPADETAPFRPGDHYQQSKLDGEKLALSYVKKGLGVVVFRPAGIFGPGDTRFLKLFKPVSKGTFYMIGKGKNLYHLTYIDDLVEGIVMCGEKEGIEGEAFILAGPAFCTVRELVRAIAKSLGRSVNIRSIPVGPVWAAAVACEVICRALRIEPPLFRRRLDFFLKDRAFDISKARRILGYEPRVSLNDGLLRTVEWYRAKNLII